MGALGNFTKKNMRFAILFSACANIFANYYCYDIPQALQTPLTNPNKMNLSDSSYNLLYSTYSIPNIILPFFYGIFIDKMGSSNGVILSSFTILISQIIFFCWKCFGNILDYDYWKSYFWYWC